MDWEGVMLDSRGSKACNTFVKQSYPAIGTNFAFSLFSYTQDADVLLILLETNCFFKLVVILLWSIYVWSDTEKTVSFKEHTFHY